MTTTTKTKTPATHHGDLVVTKPGETYEFKEITGNVYVCKGASLTADKLISVGGGVAVREGASLTADKLTSVGGGVDVYEGASLTADKLTSVGGSVYVYEGGKASLPKNCKQNDPTAPVTCRRNLFETNLKLGYYYADGILSRLVNRKGKVARVIICGKTAISYVVDDGNGNYSHGATLEEARRGLLYKLSSRDTTSFKAWTRQTTVSLAEAIQAYRAITGACELGTRHFCEQSGTLPKTLTIAEAINRTRGQYGSEAFAKFFPAAKARSVAKAAGMAL